MQLAAHSHFRHWALAIRLWSFLFRVCVRPPAGWAIFRLEISINTRATNKSLNGISYILARRPSNRNSHPRRAIVTSAADCFRRRARDAAMVMVIYYTIYYSITADIDGSSTLKAMRTQQLNMLGHVWPRVCVCHACLLACFRSDVGCLGNALSHRRHRCRAAWKRR